MPRGARISVIDEASRISKKTPGPSTYKEVGQSKDKMCLARTLGTYKSSLKKMSSIDLESFAKKELPGPLNKYRINYRLVEPREPFYAQISKSLGRDNKPKGAPGTSINTRRIQKDNSAGPGTYNVEKGLLKLSSMVKPPYASSVSGLSMAEAAKPNLLHIDKLKVKSERGFERLVRMRKARAPGVGIYKNTESAFDMTSRLPRSLSKKRH